MKEEGTKLRINPKNSNDHVHRKQFFHAAPCNDWKFRAKQSPVMDRRFIASDVGRPTRLTKNVWRVDSQRKGGREMKRPPTQDAS